MKSKLNTLLFLGLFTMSSLIINAQERSNIRNNSIDVVMTWNKNTPEQEMLDDIKALKESGVTIKFSNVKRNATNEIIAIKLEYKDTEGNTGSQEYNGKTPIANIEFHKNKNEIGFGKSTNSKGMAFNNFAWNQMQKPLLQEFNFDLMQPDKFEFENDLNQKPNLKSKIIIQKEGKQPLVIEDGEVIEGGEGYSEEEIENIKKQNRFQLNDNEQNFNFPDNPNATSLDSLKKQLDKMQQELNNLKPDATPEKKEKVKEKKETIEIKKTYKI